MIEFLTLFMFWAGVLVTLSGTVMLVGSLLSYFVWRVILLTLALRTIVEYRIHRKAFKDWLKTR